MMKLALQSYDFRSCHYVSKKARKGTLFLFVNPPLMISWKVSLIVSIYI